MITDAPSKSKITGIITFGLDCEVVNEFAAPEPKLI